MKSPLWIINSILAIILAVLFTYILYSVRTLFEQPKAASIKGVSSAAHNKKEEVKPQDLSLIYEEYDLFGTYLPSITTVKAPDILPAIPASPDRIPLTIKPKPVSSFSKPLPYKITGIIASNNEMKSQVSLFNTNSGKTESFNCGDKILDAYILRIFPRKILVVRSNGQEEAIYLYQEDAKLAMAQMQDTTWSDVIQQRTSYEYLVNPATFQLRIHSLANLLDMIDLTTASQNGKPVGLRVGSLLPTSIGFAAGFIPGDIITSIMHRAPFSTPERVAILNEISALQHGDRIEIEFIRNGSSYAHTYKLFDLTEDAPRRERTRTPNTTPQEKLPTFVVPSSAPIVAEKKPEPAPLKSIPVVLEQPKKTTEQPLPAPKISLPVEPQSSPPVVAPAEQEPIPAIPVEQKVAPVTVQPLPEKQPSVKEIPVVPPAVADVKDIVVIQETAPLPPVPPRAAQQDPRKQELDAMKKFGGKAAHMAPLPGTPT